jgi:hypothetical protein
MMAKIEVKAPVSIVTEGSVRSLQTIVEHTLKLTSNDSVNNLVALFDASFLASLRVPQSPLHSSIMQRLTKNQTRQKVIAMSATAVAMSQIIALILNASKSAKVTCANVIDNAIEPPKAFHE